MPACLLVALVVLMTWAPPLAAETRDPRPVEGAMDESARETFLADLEQAFSRIETVRVRFHQERHLELFTEPVVSEGVLIFARPDRLHWEWVTPYGALLVLCRGDVARFDIDDGALRRLRPAGEEALRSVALQMTRWLQGRFRDSSDVFEVQVIAGPPARIVLTPRSEGLTRALERIEVELADGHPVHLVTLLSPGGDRTVMTFVDERRNLSLPEALFSLDDPSLAGAEDDHDHP